MKLFKGIVTTCFAFCLSQVNAQQNGSVSNNGQEGDRTIDQVMTKIKNDIIRTRNSGDI